MTPALEDSLSQEVQDSFSFLEDLSSSEPEWVGVEDREVAKAEAAGAAAFSLGEDDPGMGYLEELLRVGHQVEEFSVEPPLDDLSLDDAQYVLAPNCCSLDSPDPTPDVEEDYGEEVFLSAYDDLSPLLGPKPINWEGVGSLEEEAARCGKNPPTQAEEEQACSETRQDKEAEPRSTSDNREEAEATPETEIEAGKADEEGGEAERSQKVMGSFEEGSREGLEAKEENSKGQEVKSIEKTKDMDKTRGEQGKDEKEREIGRKEAEKGEDNPVESEMDPEHVLQEYLVPEESWEVVHKHEAEKGREGEIKGLRRKSDHKSREDQGHGEDSRSPDDDDGKAGGVSKEQKSTNVETEGIRGVGDHLGQGALSEGPGVELLRVDSTEEINEQTSEMEQTPLQPSEPEGMEAEGQLNPETCDLYSCPCGSAGGVGMRLASTLVQVRQVRSVPVVPPKPQFAKMPSAMCSKIHVAPASPCPRPGRLDGTPGEKAWSSRASWRNGGSLSFDAAVALARERQRTEAQGVRRTQTCTGGGDYSLNSRTSPCSLISAHSSQPLSCLELPPEGTEGSEPRSRLSLPPRELHPAVPPVAPQRQTYAFETQTKHRKDEGV